MGTIPSTPRSTSFVGNDTVEYIIATFVGEKSFPLNSEFWHKFLQLPLQFHWPPDRVRQACESLAHNNYHTRHLSKLLIHLAYCLQDCISSSGAPSINKALNAAYFTSVFLVYIIENSKTSNFEELHLALDDNEVPSAFPKGQSVENIVVHSVLNFISTVEASPHTYLLHCELLNFMMVAMSTQLLSGPSPGQKDYHPFLDAVMSQEASLVALVVSKLLLNYISQPRSALNGASYSAFPKRSQLGVLQRVGSAAANFVLLPLNLIVGSSNESSRSLLARSSLHILLILVHFRKCAVLDEPISDEHDGNAAPEAVCKEKTFFCENPFCKALETARDIEFDRLDVEGNAHCGPLARVSFASLYDTIGMCLADEAAVLLLYSLAHGNADFLEYVLVRTDLDTLLMPMLEILYNAPKRTSNQIYMLLITLLILSQDSTFNASIHKLLLPNVPWYKERRLNHTSLGSLMVIVLIRTVNYNLSRLQDVYLHTNCLATLANMAPHVHRLDAYASQRLVSLFHMLSRKFTRLAELQNDKMRIDEVNSLEGDNVLEDVSMELHIYTDFLRIVLEIINAILTYALPRNPEVVYAVMHRQEVFQPFRNHPRFSELVENIFTVLDFFNSRMDAQEVNGEWSVEKVLQIITCNCRSWRGEGMKMFTQMRFTYEQESHPEEFFIPYVWELAVANCGFAFDSSKINLYSVDLPIEGAYDGDANNKHEDEKLNANDVELDP